MTITTLWKRIALGAAGGLAAVALAVGLSLSAADAAGADQRGRHHHGPVARPGPLVCCHKGKAWRLVRAVRCRQLGGVRHPPRACKVICCKKDDELKRVKAGRCKKAGGERVAMKECKDAKEEEDEDEDEDKEEETKEDKDDL